jgi:hypothetical protein
MERRLVSKGKKFWGESWWDGLHSCAAVYTPDHASDVILLIRGYKGSLPCRQCREHFSQNLILYPIKPYLTDNIKLLFWTYIIHDSVNKVHNSHNPDDIKISPPFEDVVRKYTSLPENWDRSWKFILHSAAAVYTSESANDFVCLVKALTGLIPSRVSRVKFVKVLEECPVEPYLRNNHDLFFWSYVVCNSLMGSGRKKAEPFEDVKRYFFVGLGEDCKACENQGS